MLRAAAKSLAFRSGVMELLHRVRDRESLAVVMFHRVLPAEEQVRSGADPDYSVTPYFLADCLDYLTRHYTVVSLDDVLASWQRTRPLPPYPVMITFDDGWYDNAEWAEPVLRNIPWTLFVTTDAVSEAGAWWQEVLLSTLRSGRADFDEILHSGEAFGARFPDESQIDAPELCLLTGYGGLPAESRRRAIAAVAGSTPHDDIPHMLSKDQLSALMRGGVAVGAHGASHLPPAAIPDFEADLRRARDWLRESLGSDATRAMSFPHGRWNEKAAQAARTLGLELMFTSDAVLNPCPRGWLESDIVGRIPIATFDVADGCGRLAAPRIAAWLYRRDRQAIKA
jgi:peptidoglycan/xylan/chitin deacetylase (PgdA/CDA1 family)